MRKLIFLLFLFLISLINLSLVNSVIFEEGLKKVEVNKIITKIDENLGVLVGREVPQPKTKGYIIQLKEKPILERKIEIERNVIEMEKKGGKYIIEAEILREGLPSQLKEQKNKIASEHEIFLTKASTILQHPKKKIIREFKVAFNGLVLNISKSEAEELKKMKEVKGVYLNVEVKAFLMDSIPLINADDVWQLQINETNITGQNATIAILDTGIDYTHPDLGNCTQGDFLAGNCSKVVDGYDFVNEDNDPLDDNGHGTHVAGIAAGNGTLKGVASDAKLFAYKVLDSGGSGWSDDIIAAIERAQDPNQDGDHSDHVDIISMSLGGWGDPDDPMSQAVDTAVENGVVVVVAAGNNGPYNETIGSPGTARKAITIGATYKTNYSAFWWDCTPGEYTSCGLCESNGTVWCDYWGDENPQPDQITSFSSRGPTSVGTKPDVVAPGAIICSARYDYIYPSGEHPYYYPCVDEGHFQAAGTSMATPHAAGVVALVKQAHPDWDTNEIESALKITAVDIGEDINTQGYGRVNVLSAVQLTSKPPVAVIETSGKFHGTEINVTGTAKAENFENYTLYYKLGQNVGPNGWNEICFSTIPVINNTLCSWNISLLSDGEYTLKLEARSQDQTSKDMVFVTIKNTEITSPKDLMDIEWPEPGEVIPTWENIIINGTSIGYNFDHYTLEWCINGICRSEGITLTDNGLNPVEYGILGFWNASTLTESDFYFIRLTTYYTDKQVTDEVKIYIDTDLQYGWPRSIRVEGSGIFLYSFLDQPTVSDLDSDGEKELIDAYGRYITVFKHDGSYLEGWPKMIETSCGNNSSMQNGPAVADLDDDGYGEIVIGDNCGYLHILNHNGTYFDVGTQTTSTTTTPDGGGGGGGGGGGIWPKDIGCYLNTPTIADIGNDGNLDIIVGDWCGYLHVLNLTGNYLDGWPKFLPPSYSPSYTHATRGSASIADLDKDVYNEIIVTSRACNQADCYNDNVSTRIWVLNHDGTNVTGWPKEFYKMGTYGSYPVLADMDNDDEIEIIVGTYAGEVYAWNIDGSNVTGWPVNTTADSLGSPAVGDVDNDENLEILISGEVGWEDCLFVYKNNGVQENIICEGWGNPMIGNLDVDGGNEISISGSIWATYGLYEFYAYNPDGTTVMGFPKMIDASAFSNGAPIADLDNDGDNELIVYTDVGSLFVWDLPGSSGNDEWPVFYHDEKHTGLYVAPPEPQYPQWFNLKHEPTSVMPEDSVDVSVQWSDDVGLDTVVISENSTGLWEDHICSLATGQCSGESAFIKIGIFTVIIIVCSSILVFSYKTEILKSRGVHQTILLFSSLILIIILISILFFPEIQRDVSRLLTRLGIIPMAIPQTFTHTIPSSQLDAGEVVAYKSYANDTDGNRVETMTKTFLVQTPPPPDLTLSSFDIVVSNTSPSEGETITINATVRNDGYSSASDVVVQFFNEHPMFGQQIGDNQTIDFISGGESKIISVSWTPSYGYYYIYVSIDPDNKIPESNEYNNIVSKYVRIAPDTPDIKISWVYVGDLIVNETTNTSIEILNEGTKNATDAWATMYVYLPNKTEAFIENKTIGLVPVDNFAKVNFTWTPELVGYHTLRFIVNCTGDWYSDNEGWSSVYVYPDAPDITGSVSTSPAASGFVNQTFDVRIYVENKGGRNATNVTAELYDYLPNSTRVKIWNKSVGNLSSAMEWPHTYSEQIEWTPTTVGNHILQLIVNSTDDWDDTNNAYNYSVVVYKPINVTFYVTDHLDDYTNVTLRFEVPYMSVLIPINITQNITLPDIGKLDIWLFRYHDGSIVDVLILWNSTLNETMKAIFEHHPGKIYTDNLILHSIIVYNTSWDYNNVTMAFPIIGYELHDLNKTSIYTCSGWSWDDEKCTSSWDYTNATHEFEGSYDEKYLFSDVTSTDAFTFAEPQYCGDGYCSPSESCSSCPDDCGSCPTGDGGDGDGGAGPTGGGAGGTATTTGPATTIILTTTSLPRITTTIPACISTGESCESDSNCCSGYCCGNVCSDEECREVGAFSTFNILLIVGLVSVSIPVGYVFYTKFIKRGIPKKIEIHPEKLEDELRSLKKIAEDLRLKGYDVSTVEKELSMAENAITEGLISSAKIHLKRAREYHNLIKQKKLRDDLNSDF